jgi:Ca-activated chloride channel homolog
MLKAIFFENPDLLHLLWVAPVYLLLLAVYWVWRRNTLRRMGSPALAQRLLLGFSGRRFWLKNIFFLLSLCLIGVAIANPRRLTKQTKEARQSADVYLALDVSQSMLARDVAPSRLEQAKAFSKSLVQALEGERVGVIFYAGDAYPQMPLSLDYEAALLFLRNADTDYITNQGTAVASAIELAARSFEPNSDAGRALVILSDGENHEGEGMVHAKASAREAGMTLFCVGFGTDGGSGIPGRTGQKRDSKGQVIRTRLDAPALRELTEYGANRGTYYSADDAGAVAALSADLDKLQTDAVAALSTTAYTSYFQLLIIPALLLLMAEQWLWWRKRTA